MSVAGIDVGDACSCIAVARKRGVDVLLNKESKRETPTLVAFGPKTRALGTDAVGSLTVNPKNTVSGLKRLLGARWGSPALESELPRLPFEVVADPAGSGGVAVRVEYLGEQKLFTPEQLLAMVIVDQKAVAAADGSPVTDCVMTVPVYWTQAQREAALAAADIAGVSCLRLLHETTAAALAYGIYKTDLPEGGEDSAPINVAFVDAGASSFQVSIVAFKKGQLKVLAHTWDADLGGRNFDDVLFDHWAKEFGAKHRIDVKSSARGSFRLRLSCEKQKKLLSSIPEAPITCEGLAPEVDASGVLSRDAFQDLAAPLLARFKAPLEAALLQSKLSTTDIFSVEVVGGASRMPSLLETVAEVFGKQPSRTLNAKECVARGAALCCAMLSPIFRVRDFDVDDVFPYGIEFSWPKEPAAGAKKNAPVERATSVLFEKGTWLGSAKMLTFVRDATIDVDAAYTDDSPLPTGADTSVGSWTVGPPLTTPLRPKGTKAKLKAKVKLTAHGTVSIDYVQQIEEESYEEKVKVKKGSKAALAAEANGGECAAAPAEMAVDGETTAEEDGTGAAAAAAMDSEGPGTAEADGGAAADAEAEEQEITVTKTRTKKHTVAFDRRLQRYSQKRMTDLCEAELQMALATKQQEETNERKNALEAFIFSTRSALSEDSAGSLGKHASDKEKENLSKALEAAEDWLYDDGEDAARSAYVSKLDDLRALAAPAQARARNAAALPGASAGLEALARNLVIASAPDKAHEGCDAGDLAKVKSEAEAALAWLAEKKALAAKAAPADEPPLLADEVDRKKATLQRFSEPLMAAKAAPAPAPAAPEPAAEEKAAGEEAPMQEEADLSAPVEGEATMAELE